MSSYSISIYLKHDTWHYWNCSEKISWSWHYWNCSKKISWCIIFQSWASIGRFDLVYDLHFFILKEFLRKRKGEIMIFNSVHAAGKDMTSEISSKNIYMLPWQERLSLYHNGNNLHSLVGSLREGGRSARHHTLLIWWRQTGNGAERTKLQNSQCLWVDRTGSYSEREIIKY